MAVHVCGALWTFIGCKVKILYSRRVKDARITHISHGLIPVMNMSDLMENRKLAGRSAIHKKLKYKQEF